MHDHPDTRNNEISTHGSQPAIDTGMLPDQIARQVDKLNELDASVKAAIAAAKQAEKHASDASQKSAGRGLFADHKKAAIEELQSSGIMLAKAIQLGVKAQKTSFEFQQRLADITKYLFKLGVSSIAANRFVVRELELRLQGASEEKLSELARQEILLVVKQLKDQEDILKKQESILKRQKIHDSKIKHALEQTDSLESRIKDQSAQQAEIDLLQDTAISNLEEQAQTKEKLDSSQDATIRSLSTELALLRSQLTSAESALQTHQKSSAGRIASLEKKYGYLRLAAIAELVMNIICILAIIFLLLPLQSQA